MGALAAIGAAAGTIAQWLPYIDQAIKDQNYKEVKKYQSLINRILSQYNVTMADLNKALNKYQTQYSEAFDLINSSVRGSTQHKVGQKELKSAKQGIESTQKDISTKTKQYEEAVNAVKDKQAKYDNKGLLGEIGDLVNGSGDITVVSPTKFLR